MPRSLRRRPTRNHTHNNESTTQRNVQMKTQGIHHLGLTVSDLSASTEFFVKCLGWSVAGRMRRPGELRHEWRIFFHIMAG